DDFIRWTYRKALDHRQPRYRAMANRWGITVKAEDIYAVRSAEDFQELIARTLEARA
ncbi:MAG: ATPase, partial [Marivivens sp.]|nr:ATPase [Marivivens sp.]